MRPTASGRRLYPLGAHATFDGVQWRLMLPKKAHTCDVCYRPVGPGKDHRAAWITPPQAPIGAPRRYRCQGCGPEPPPRNQEEPQPGPTVRD